MKNGNRRFGINMFATLFAFIVNLAINFVLSPFVINKLGSEAYGFVNLANNIANYASLLTIALNSLASRFITISYHKKRIQEATEYFNSVLYANIFLGAIIMAIFLTVSAYLEYFINIPANMIIEVKILFVLIFANTVLSLVNSTFSVATFIKNRLDLSSIRTLESIFIKAAILFVTFMLFSPNIFYFGIAVFISTIFVFITNCIYKRKLVPEIKISLRFFKRKKAFELVKSGSWNVITSVGQILINGLNLLISNIFIGPLAMGQLAIAQLLSTQFSNFMATLASVFNPRLTEIYAQQSSEHTANQLIFNMKIAGFFASICLSCILIWGKLFYSLWLPKEDSFVLWKLTLLLMIGVFASGAVHPLFYVYPLTKKIKTSALMQLGSGFLNLILVLPLLHYTSLGLYAVAGVSTCISLVRDLTFTPMYAANCLGVRRITFYPVIVRYLCSLTVILFLQFWANRIMQSNTWGELILGCILGIIIGGLSNFAILFNAEERQMFFNAIRFRIKGKLHF